MAEAQKVWYVLFPNHNEGMNLHRLLRGAGLSSTIAPTPRKLSHSCGVSLIVDEEQLEAVHRVVWVNEVEILGIEPLEKDIDPRRDRYC